MHRNPSSLKMALLSLLILAATSAFGQQNWKDIRSVSELYNVYPTLVKEVFKPIDLDYPGLESVKLAYERQDWVVAAEELLRYYQASENSRELAKDIPAASNLTVQSADTVLNYVFTIQNVRGAVPIGPDGHRDWYYKGPNNDREWAWLSNRHTQLAQVMNTYFETGNLKYAQ